MRMVNLIDYGRQSSFRRGNKVKVDTQSSLGA
jgi:hypothetical protein